VPSVGFPVEINDVNSADGFVDPRRSEGIYIGLCVKQSYVQHQLMMQASEEASE
jgi:hypothetical protein